MKTIWELQIASKEQFLVQQNPSKSNNIYIVRVPGILIVTKSNISWSFPRFADGGLPGLCCFLFQESSLPQSSNAFDLSTIAIFSFINFLCGERINVNTFHMWQVIATRFTALLHFRNIEVNHKLCPFTQTLNRVMLI